VLGQQFPQPPSKRVAARHPVRRGVQQHVRRISEAQSADSDLTRMADYAALIRPSYGLLTIRPLKLILSLNGSGFLGRRRSSGSLGPFAFYGKLVGPKCNPPILMLPRRRITLR
jgi:hypothetical protein